MLRTPKFLRLKVQCLGSPPFYFDETVLPILMLAFLGGGGKARGVGILVALLFLVILHEMAHWLVGRCQGYRCRAVRMGLFHGYCWMSSSPDMRMSIGHLLFALAGVGAEFVVLVAAVLLHHLNIWPSGSLFLGVYKGFTIYSLLLIFVNLWPHDGSDGEQAIRIIRELCGSAEDVDPDPKGG